MNSRQSLLQTLATQILTVPTQNVLRVAIDGVDGAGKTVFADELALILAAADRPIIRAGIDSFHNPRAVRYRRGATSPEGFFHDSYNYPVLKELLLEPLSPEGNGQFQRGAFDHRSDKPLDFPLETSATNAILLFDGIFLHNTELRNYWDFSIFLEVGFAISIPRGAQRGEGSPDPLAPSNRRYVEGQKLYLSHCRPHAIATVVVNNEDMDNPFFARGPARGH